MNNNQRLLFAGATIFSVVLLLIQGPIPQDPAYHDFADQRTIFGVPNFWNVVSNLPMLFLGLYGFQMVLRRFQNRPDFSAKWMPVLLTFGIFITSFGSGYYHFAPDNE